MNDDERRQWVANDEALYRWQQASRLGEAAFARAHRAEIDTVIQQRLQVKPR